MKNARLASQVGQDSSKLTNITEIFCEQNSRINFVRSGSGRTQTEKKISILDGVEVLGLKSLTSAKKILKPASHW